MQYYCAKPITNQTYYGLPLLSGAKLGLRDESIEFPVMLYNSLAYKNNKSVHAFYTNGNTPIVKIAEPNKTDKVINLTEPLYQYKSYENQELKQLDSGEIVAYLDEKSGRLYAMLHDDNGKKVIISNLDEHRDKYVLDCRP